ncbi:hypothetical protein EG329_013422 [Mollisiaceae sp. DMI_Dod_QoI]|nr:hypothetical protein EG329_013422 [Helotiales sp. DMI_Dod_QoI]
MSDSSESEPENEVIAVYDLFWTSVTGEGITEGHNGDRCIFRRYEPEAKASEGEETEDKATYKAFWNYGMWNAVFSCTTSDDERTFSDFVFLSADKELKEQIKGLDEEWIELVFIDTLDDDGFPFMYWWKDCGILAVRPSHSVAGPREGREIVSGRMMRKRL